MRATVIAEQLRGLSPIHLQSLIDALEALAAQPATPGAETT
jgi:hypothetical protein